MESGDLFPPTATKAEQPATVPCLRCFIIRSIQPPRHAIEGLPCGYSALGALCYRAQGAMQRKNAGQHGDVAQLAEHLLCKQGVVGSSPIISTTTATALLSRGADGPSFG